MKKQSIHQQKMCIWSILSIIFAFLFPLLGIILGIVALIKIKENSNLKGKGLAIAGLTIGTLFLILSFVLIILFIMAWPH